MNFDHRNFPPDLGAFQLLDFDVQELWEAGPASRTSLICGVALYSKLV